MGFLALAAICGLVTVGVGAFSVFLSPADKKVDGIAIMLVGITLPIVATFFAIITHSP